MELDKNREFSKEQKDQIWDKYFPNTTSANDVFGEPMTKEHYQADHTWPYIKGGKTVLENGFPLAAASNDSKHDYFEGVVNGKNFKVIKVSPGIGHLSVEGKDVSK